MNPPLQGSRGVIRRTELWYSPGNDPTTESPLPPSQVTTATVAQQIGAQGEQVPRYQQVSTGQTWFAPDAAVEGLPPRVSAYDFTKQPWQERPEQDALRGNQQTWYAPDAQFEGFVPLPSAYDPGRVSWLEQPGQERSIAEKWLAPEAAVEGLLPPAGFNPGAGFDWSEQPGSWVDWTPWSAPQESVEGLLPPVVIPTFIQTEDGPALWLGANWAHADASHDPLLPPAGFNPGAGFDWSDSSAQQDMVRPETWLQPADLLGVREPPISGEFDPATGFDWSDQPQFWLGANWTHVDPAADVPFVPPPPAPFDPSTGFEWGDLSPQQFPWAILWYQEPDDELGAVPIPDEEPLPSPISSGYPMGGAGRLPSYMLPAHLRPGGRKRKRYRARSLMDSLTKRYGLAEADKIYGEMEQKQLGPFAPGKKYGR